MNLIPADLPVNTKMFIIWAGQHSPVFKIFWTLIASERFELLCGSVLHAVNVNQGLLYF